MKICNQCHKTFSDSEAFCDTCGAPLSYDGRSVNENGNKEGTVKKKPKTAMIAISVLAVVSVVLSIMLYNQYSNRMYLRRLTTQLENKVDEYENEKIPELENEVKLYKERMDTQANKLDFYLKYIVLVGEDRIYYHKYGCEDFTGGFSGYNISQAQDLGYSACPKCYGEE